jgi:hypothetical protein
MLDIQQGGPNVARKPSTDAEPDASGAGGGGGDGGGGEEGSASGDSNSFGAASLDEGPVLGFTTEATKAPDENFAAGGDLTDILGFDVRLSADGIFVRPDIDLSQVLPDHLVSDMPTALELTATAKLSDVLGFDAHLGVPGLFGVHGSAGGLTVSVGSGIDTANLLKSTLAEITGLQLFGDSGSLTAQLVNKLDSTADVLGFDAQLGVPGVFGVHGSAGGLTVRVDSGMDTPQLLESTLAETTGLQLFGDSGSLTAQLVNKLDGTAAATLTKALDIPTTPSGHSVASEPARPVAQVFDLQDLGELKPAGDVAAGAAVDFPAQTLPHLAVNAGTGPHLFGDDSSAASAIAPTPLAGLTSATGDSVTSEPATLAALSDLKDLGELKPAGDMTAGAAVDAPAQMLPQLAVNAGAGPHLFGDGSSAASAIAPTRLGSLTGPTADGGTSEPATPVAAVSDIKAVGELNKAGDISSGDTLNFPAQTLTQVDELFSGHRYTDYHVTLQTQNPDPGQITTTQKIDPVDHAEAIPATTDTQLPVPHNEATAPSPTIEQPTDPLAPTSLHQLASH